MRIHRRKQRGVVLLVVVSMLVLFVLIGVTYAIVATQYRRGARIVSRTKQLGVDPEQHLDSALYQVLRDTRSRSSVLRGHSLLRDMYGDSVRGKINANPTILQSNQFLRFTAVPLPRQPWDGQWKNTRNYYAGCVLTFTSGTFKGTSTRIIGYRESGGTLAFDVMLPQINQLPTPLPKREVEFVVNGHPFSGSGFGHLAGSLDLTDQALKPNRLGINNAASPAASTYLAGGANESYDAVDYQNMALAAVIPSEGKVIVIPSFHRPALINYWKTKGMGTQELRQRVIMRPMTLNHPYFTGSNPLFNPLNPKTWDVDNDNDGIVDSIWTDLGMPVQTDASGRKYKPLFAVMCVDMDGKLNLNAHGNYSHVLAGGQAAPQEVRLAGGVGSRNLRPAQGFGPGEISFRGICANQAAYAQLLQNRYGRDGFPGKTDLDLLAEVKLYSYLFSPEDLHGEVAFGIDHFGQPVFETARRNIGGKSVVPNFRQLVTNTPYEMNLSQPHQRGWSTITNPTDTPYSVAELERVLRSNDADQKALPGRLQSISGANHLVTTDSYDLPVANGSDKNLDLIRSLIVNQMPDFPPELQLGIRWNINQPFGNGRDDNNNGVIDEVKLWDQKRDMEVMEADMETWTTTAFPFDHDNDGHFGLKFDPNAGEEARQQYAKRLYSLMQLMLRWDVNSATLIPLPQWDTDGDGNKTTKETAERLAQWAVNVVDFRDSDSIMTRFPYDVEPLNGSWTPNDAKPVWGCERPELLITETHAFHDRRTEDLDTDSSMKKTDDTDDPDEDFDQRLRPRGSLFIELYNPWTGGISPLPNELYMNRGGVVLNGHPGGSPTWRMLIVKGNLKGTDPDSWTVADASDDVERSIYFTKPGTVALPGDADGQHYRPNGNNQTIAPLQPGRYAVVGSSGQYISATDSYITTIGRRTDATEDDASTLLYDTTRHIRMKPNANGNQFQVRNNRGATSPLMNQAQPVVAIPINHPRSLSISEPTAGYPAGDWDPALVNGEGAYATPKDEPDDDLSLRKNTSYINYRTIYLQRLANPLLPWHTKNNPYRTVDSMSVDLTTFNGVTNDENQHPDAPDQGNETACEFFTHERGRSQADNGNKHPRNLWKHETDAWTKDKRPAIEPGQGDAHYFNYDLPNSLGWLNIPYQPAIKVPGFYLGAPDTTGGRPAFSWLTWKNRSFVNPHELMSVPFSSQYQLLHDFDLNGTFPSPYQADNDEAVNPGDFGHLLNFFNEDDGLYRLFEFIQTPSPFVRAETVLNPQQFTGRKSDQSSDMLHPPFNQISSFRDPGKINLNTIFDSTVWDGIWNNDLLLHKDLHVSDTNGNVVAQRQFASIGWNQFIASRRGYGANTDGTIGLTPNNQSPSYFSNPFRDASSRTIQVLRPETPIESTIMRSDAIGGTPSDRPLFSSNSIRPSTTAVWSSHFRYQPLQRLSNLTTTRSNVYAIWITVGYFEVTHGAVDSAHPDGYRLGQELGWDRGGIRRHRAFYMVDRSIPVAYEPGENHNVDRAILLRRFIE